MPSPTIKSSISTDAPKPKIKLPLGLKMALDMFGITNEQIEKFMSTIDVVLESGAADKLLLIPATIERFEKKLDAICEKLGIEIPE